MRGRFEDPGSQRSIRWEKGKYTVKKLLLPSNSLDAPRSEQYINYVRAQSAAHKYRRTSAAHQAHTYPVKVKSDGTFQIKFLPPGEYMLESEILRSLGPQNTKPKRERLLGQDTRKISIPDGPAELPFNLGTIPVPTIPID